MSVVVAPFHSSHSPDRSYMVVATDESASAKHSAVPPVVPIQKRSRLPPRGAITSQADTQACVWNPAHVSVFVLMSTVPVQ